MSSKTEWPLSHWHIGKSSGWGAGDLSADSSQGNNFLSLDYRALNAKSVDDKYGKHIYLVMCKYRNKTNVMPCLQSTHLKTGIATMNKLQNLGWWDDGSKPVSCTVKE